MNKRKCDIVIVGTGIAGLSSALSFNENCNIIIVSEDIPDVSGSTPYAQGGIAFAKNNDESIISHINDTISAGAGLCNENIVNDFISNSADTVNWLINQGADFDRNNDGTLQKGREAAHSENRIVHIGGDSTGIGIITAMVDKARSKKNIEFIIGKLSKLLTDDNGSACGIEVNGIEIESSSVIFATGGGAGLFSDRTAPAQPLTAFKLALDAGAKASDMEFFQFHPTALDLPHEIKPNLGRIPLISEAVRGQGAILITNDGNLKINHKDGSLAPRDVVSRAVFDARSIGKQVFLDTSSIDNFNTRFPTIAKICNLYEINTDKIPVKSAVHYQIGGISTDLHGITDVQGLYVIGEAAATGLHGANRLASNSLLEASIMGRMCAKKIESLNILSGKTKYRIKGEKDISQNIVQYINNRALGISRNYNTLHDSIINLKNMPQSPNVVASQMAMLFALKRTESIGSHYRSDYPEKKLLARQFMDLNTFEQEIKNII